MAYPPSLYPCQLRCYSCGTISTMPPSNTADNFICSNCHFFNDQLILPFPFTSLNPPVPLPTAHGINPYNMQVVCAHCMAILNIPPHCLGFSSTLLICPLCRLHLPFYMFPVSPSTLSSPSAQQLDKVQVLETVDGGDMKNITSLESIIEEEPLRSIFLLKDRKRIREFEQVDDCFILDFDPYGFSSCSKPLDDHDVILSGEQEQCYCCDMPAPCKKWTKGIFFIIVMLILTFQHVRILETEKEENIPALKIVHYFEVKYNILTCHKGLNKELMRAVSA